jgi:hypothetical protein
MKPEIVSLESAVKQPFLLRVDGKEYTIEFPLAAVAQAEEKLNRSLKTPVDWFTAPAKDIPALLAAGLAKRHPEVKAEDVAAICDALGPEAITEVTEALGALAFPKWTAKYKENLEKARAGTLPKAPGAVVL